MLLGDDILVSDEPCQIMILVVDEILEIIVERVGIAETVPVSVVEGDDRMSRILLRGIVSHLVGGQTEEALVVLCIVVIAELSLCRKVLDEFPTERTAEVEVFAIFLAVVVGSRGDGIIEVHIVVVERGVLCCEALQGDWRVDDGVFESLICVVRASSIVGTTTTDVGVAETSLEVKRGALGGLGVEFEREVVTLEVRADHDGLVVHVGIAEGILDGFRSSRDVEALVEGVAHASVGDVLPVVALYVVVEVEILIVAEERGEG